MVEGSFEDFEVIMTPGHIDRVREILSRGFVEWSLRYVAEAPVGREKHVRHHGNAFGDYSPEQRLARRAVEAVRSHTTRHREHYDILLDPEVLEEYRKEPRLYVKEAENSFPVLRKALHSEMDGLDGWKARFRQMARRRPNDFFALVCGLVEFQDVYTSRISLEEFGRIETLEELALERLDSTLHWEEYGYSIEPVGSESPAAALFIPGIVNSGITSTILHHLQPAYFPPRNRHALHALHHLCMDETAGLDTSQFILWSLEFGTPGHNHRYPYSLYTLHALHLSRLLEEFYAAHDVEFDTAHRMVLVMDFLYFVAEAGKGVFDGLFVHEARS